MEPLGDDELLYIFNKIPRYDWEDKRLFAQVSKQFMKVACTRLYSLRNSFPNLLFDILPSSSNMTSFSCYKPLSNTHLKLLAQSCPNLKTLKLATNHDLSSEPRDFEFDFDFDDDGLCAVANSCNHLYEVYLDRRLHVGDAGIVSLVMSCKNLTRLNLEGCIRVTDESLKAIGNSRIRYLNLEGCYLITDMGLEYLVNGNLKNCLQHLNLADCNKVTNNGIVYLKLMAGITELSLSKCGAHVTDYAIVDVSSNLQNIEILDLSWLINVTDISLIAIGSKCLRLEKMILTGCEAITAEGLRAFTGHQTLKRLVLFSCYNFSWEDVESVALSCRKLEYLGLMKKIKTPMPESSTGYLSWRGIDWDEDSGTLFW